METILSGIIVLCMFYQGGIIEHTYVKDQKMSSCLKLKRQINRDLNLERVRMQCGEVKAIIEEDKHNGRMRVVKIIEDKYGKY